MFLAGSVHMLTCLSACESRGEVWGWVSGLGARAQGMPDPNDPNTNPGGANPFNKL